MLCNAFTNPSDGLFVITTKVLVPSKVALPMYLIRSCQVLVPGKVLVKVPTTLCMKCTNTT